MHPNMINQTLSKLDGKDIITKYEILNNINENYKFQKNLKLKEKDKQMLEEYSIPECQDDVPVAPVNDSLPKMDILK